ncbi:MAG: phosphoglycerate mutase family protein [Ignavibacteria bacterium]
MKPKRIILIRHGQSEANHDWAVYESIQTHKVKLTAEGVKQSIQAGKELKKIIKNESIHFYISPYTRTRETFEGLLELLGSNKYKVYEEPRLREQDAGHFRDKEVYLKNKKLRENYGKFYYRFPEGESGADVYDRVSTFLETMHRDFQKKDFPRNVIIVTHGLTMRLFLMRWFHLKVEEYEASTDPKNCEFILLSKNKSGRYEIKDGSYEGFRK